MGSATASQRMFEAGFADELNESLIACAKALRPLLERNAVVHEEKGVLTSEVVEALDRDGLMRMAVPRRWGGLCVSATTMAQVAAELAKGCTSTAWVVSIINSCVWIASTMPPATQQLVFAHGIPHICGPTNGRGTVEPKDGKYVVNGRWSYGTGLHHSEWALVPVMSPEGKPQMAVLPVPDIKIEKTWHVAGMIGTGSDTVVAQDVPISRNQFCEVAGFGAIGQRAAGSEQDQEPTDYWVSFSLLRSKALGVLVGAAEGLLETVIAIREKPILYTTYKRRMDSSAWQAGVGEASAKIRAARSIMERQTGLIDNAALDRRILTQKERAELRGEAGVIAELLVYVVEKLMNLNGSSAYAESNKAQRYWRDFSIGMRHFIFSSEVAYEVYGRELIGLEHNIVGPDFV